MEQRILGVVPSKSNCYKIITIAGHASLAKQKHLKEYEKSFFLQCNKYRNANIKGLFELYIDVYFPTQRQDLDNSLKIVLDSLAQCKAIENDRSCVKIVATKYIDKLMPRIEFAIKEV